MHRLYKFKQVFFYFLFIMQLPATRSKLMTINHFGFKDFGLILI